MRLLILFFFVILAANSVEATTWYVERDGSGDYVTIQGAVDAAASGDTVRIGAGRFNEGQTVVVPGWTEFIRILIQVEELTLIGAGKYETIVGQEGDWDLTQGDHRGLQTGSYWGTRKVTVEGIRFENMAHGINDDDIDELIIRDCSFSGNRYSILDWAGACEISGTTFEKVKRDGTHLIARHNDIFRMTNCDFNHVPDGPWQQKSVNFTGMDDAVISNCTFSGGAGAVSGSSGTHWVLRNCVFNGQTTTGVYSATGCSIVVEDCILENQSVAFEMRSPDSHWEVSRTTVVNASRASLSFLNVGTGFFRDCILAKGERYVVTDFRGLAKSSGTSIHFDMRNNWWGTDNPDSIQAWIYDGVDDAESSYIIDWSPYKTEPVETQKKSFGGLKALFR